MELMIRKSARTAQVVLFTAAASNFAYMLILWAVARPERKQLLNVLPVLLVNLGVSGVITWSGQLAAKGRFGLAIGLLSSLAFLHTLLPAVFWLAGRHDGGKATIIAQVAYATLLLAATSIVAYCAWSFRNA